MVEPSTPCRSVRQRLRCSHPAPRSCISALGKRSWPETSPHRYSPRGDLPAACQLALAGDRPSRHGSLRRKTATRSCRRNGRELSAPGWLRSGPATRLRRRRRPRYWSSYSSMETSSRRSILWRCRASILSQEGVEVLPHRLECLPDLVTHFGSTRSPLRAGNQPLAVELLCPREVPRECYLPSWTGIDRFSFSEGFERSEERRVGKERRSRLAA